MERILLATFAVKVKDKRGNKQILSHFNGKDDFLDLFEKFLTSIIEKPVELPSLNGTTPLHLTIEGLPTVDKVNRVVYGYLSSGVSGETYKIRNVKTNKHVADIDSDHGAFRDLFFYFKVPKGKDTAALVLQKKAKFGAKILFNKTINEFVRGIGYQDYHVQIDNVLHHKVYQRMMELGKLTKVEIVKKKLPASIEEYYKNGEKLREVPGTLRTVMSAAGGLPNSFKAFINNRFTSKGPARFEIADNDDIDDIEFELVLGGKVKKFYMARTTRTQPDLDVTPNIEFEKGIPKIESLISEAESLIIDVINLTPENVSTD